MRLGLFLILPQPAGLSQPQVFATALEDAAAAERLGFDSVWVTEHHGSAYGLAAAPSVIAAAIAARTERLAIGYAVNVTPLHHPTRLADDIATVDHLSGGRVIAGFGAGYSPVEYRRWAATSTPVTGSIATPSTRSSTTGARARDCARTSSHTRRWR